MKLRSLNKGGRKLVDELKDGKEVGEEELKENSVETDIEIDMDKFDQIVDDAIEYIENEAKYSSDVDKIIAPKIHQLIDISKREAGDRGIWHYLAIRRADFIQARWDDPGKNHFLGARKWKDNGFARLWWAAEMSEKEGNYTYTEKILDIPDLAVATLDRLFSNHKETLHIFIDKIYEEKDDWQLKNEDLWRKSAIKVNSSLSIMVLEDCSHKEIEEIVDKAVENSKEELLDEQDQSEGNGKENSEKLRDRLPI